MVHTDAFLAWAKSRGAYLAPEVAIEPSTLGGVGIIAHKPVASDTVVLRVPQDSTYDIKTLLNYTEELKKTNKHVGKVVSSVLSLISGPTETTVIRGYMWSYAILQSMGVSMDAIAPYLDVLMSTEVLEIDEHLEVLDSLVRWQIGQKRRVVAEHADIVKAHPHYARHLSLEDAFRLHQAVKSRVLEIPHAIDDEKFQFDTQVTLVPMLDFANHLDKNNAVFDVDRNTGDVILRTTTSIGAETEVCISYSPSTDMGVFFRTYGFLPATGVYEWELPRFNDIVNTAKNTKDEDYVRMAKWLRVSPTLRLKAEEDVTVDLTESRLPLIMVPGLSYYADWRLEKKDVEEDEHDVDELIVEEETALAIVSTETAYGVVFDDAYVSIPNMLEQTWEDSEKGICELVKLTVPLVALAAKTSCEADTTTLAVTATQHESTQLGRYFEAKRKLFQRLLNHSDEEFVGMIGGFS